MHRRPHQVWQTAGLHVETGRGHAGHGNIDVRPSQQTVDRVGLAARYGSQPLPLVLVVAGLGGSLLVSYTRALGEAEGYGAD